LRDPVGGRRVPGQLVPAAPPDQVLFRQPPRSPAVRRQLDDGVRLLTRVRGPLQADRRPPPISLYYRAPPNSCLGDENARFPEVLRLYFARLFLIAMISVKSGP